MSARTERQYNTLSSLSFFSLPFQIFQSTPYFFSYPLLSKSPFLILLIIIGFFFLSFYSYFYFSLFSCTILFSRSFLIQFILNLFLIIPLSLSDLSIALPYREDAFDFDLLILMVSLSAIGFLLVLSRFLDPFSFCPCFFFFYLIGRKGSWGSF